MNATEAGPLAGAPAPDVELKAWQQKTNLASLWAGQPLALVFLHDLESPLASEAAIQWRDNGSAHVAEAGGALAAVAVASPADAAAFRERWNLPFEVYADPTGAAYAALGVTTELPGSFVIDTGGVVRYAHRNAEPLDNPPTWSLVDIIGSITGRAVAHPEPTALPSEDEEPSRPDVPKPGQKFGLDFTCVKCANTTYEVVDISATSGMLSRVVNLQNRRFSAVVCQRCRYAEFYQTNSGALRNIADLLIGS